MGMQLVKRQEKPGDIAFYIGIGIQLLIMVVGYGDWGIPLHGRLMQIAFILFCVKILTTEYSKAEWLSMFILGGIGILSYVGTKDEYVLSVIVMIFAAKNIDFNRVCKWILWIAIVFTVGTALLSLCGVGGMAVDIRDYGRGGVEARWCLGFGHANNLHGTVWYIVALAVYLYYDKINWKSCILATIGNLGLFYLTASRGGMIATQVVIILVGLSKYWKSLFSKKWIYLFATVEIIGVSILSVVSAIIPFEKHPILSIPDRLSTGRLHLAYWYADISKWNLLASGGELKAIDNGWVLMFFCYGYIIGIVFILFHILLVYKMWTNRNGVLITLLITGVFYTFMEATYMVNSAYLLCNVIYISAMIFMGEKEELPHESRELKN